MNMLSFGEIEPVWDELFPAEQARIIQLLVERVTVVPKQSS
jgi:site-specific DNA recombinase